MSYRTIEATNTKTRRIAYLQAIVSILKTGKFNQHQLLIRIMSWSAENSEHLEDYWVQTGQVTSTHHMSAGARYITLAQSFGLIASISGVYRYTRMGLILLSLLETFGASENPFYLPLSSRLFFLYLLMAKDADFVLCITDNLFSTTPPRLSNMQGAFKENFIQRLNTKITCYQDEKIRRTLLDRRLEIENWKRPERYAEHLIPPRLNWLLDLNCLEPSAFLKHLYIFRDPAKKFFEQIPLCGESNIHDVNDQWLKKDFWTNLSLLMDNSCIIWADVDEEIRSSLASEFLKMSFKYFRLTNVPRVSLTQASVYIVIAFATRKISVDPEAFSNWLSNKQVLENIRYEIRLSPRENESYIVARPI